MNIERAAQDAALIFDRLDRRYGSLRESLARIGRERAVSRSLLLVEDDPIMREALSASLELALDVPVTAVATVREAREAWERHRHGAVLVDLHLGDGPNGADLIEALPRGPRVAIYTGALDVLSGDLAAAARAVQARVIAKPTATRDIAETIRELLDEAAPLLA